MKNESYCYISYININRLLLFMKKFNKIIILLTTFLKLEYLRGEYFYFFFMKIYLNIKHNKKITNGS